jgi:tRNA G10  N-methylase Trm11
MPDLDWGLEKNCRIGNAESFTPPRKVNSIITSPPYMRQLDYGRDNRLRLWFLGNGNWKELDGKISPREARFVPLISNCLKSWAEVLLPSGTCILVVGDSYCRSNGKPLPDLISEIVRKGFTGFKLIEQHTDEIPDDRRVRRDHSGNKTETIIVLGKK